jgi:nitrite reductase/ring-hydroxylating ferredoxin subunit
MHRMKSDFADLGPLADFPEGEPVLRKDEQGGRYACVREGDAVHAVDDRCPHQGYPLSQGCVRGGVLTCEWHNWKFELKTGACTFGGEPVRRYPTRVEGGRVYLDRAVDRGAEARRLTASLRQALSRDEAARALREALRLGELGISPPGAGLGPLGVGFQLLALDGAERAEYGFDHGLAMLADLTSWVERGWVGGAEAFVQAARAVAEPSLHLGARGVARPGAGGDPRPSLGKMADLDFVEPSRVAEALCAERRDEAEALVRAVVEARGPDGAHAALIPFVTRHLYDYGHGTIFLAKALELGRRFPAAAVELAAAVTVMLAWATAETSLPPFTATREALGQAAEIALAEDPGRALGDRRAYESAVLAGERDAVRATIAELAAGVDPVALLRAAAHAAAVRLRRFDRAWERRLDAEVGVLDVTHAVTFAEAAIALAAHPGASTRDAARLAVLAAGFVGKLRRADAAEPVAATRAEGTLAEAVAARDVGRALAIAGELDTGARRAAYRDLAPFAAFDAAVRPILYAHTVKVTEAMRRLDEADADADAAYLEALVSYLAPVRRETQPRRTAAVACKFLEDGRPPEGLY